MSRRSSDPFLETIARYQQRTCTEKVDANTPWTRFAAAAGASMLLSTHGEAAIQHTDLPTPLSIDLGNQTSSNTADDLDLNIDGQDDFRIALSARTEVFIETQYIFREAAAIGLAAGNGVLGLSAGGESFAHRLDSAATISAAQSTVMSGVVRQSTFSTYSQFATGAGEWDPNETGFLGVKFQIGGQDHFGWIHVETKTNANGLLGVDIHGWAYEDVPGGAILAGDTVGQSPNLPGDFDRSGTVDAQDYALWQNTFGSSVVPGAGADGNANALIDAGDYSVWRDNLGSSQGGASATTLPEPNAANLGALALGAAGVAALRRKKPLRNRRT